MAASALPSFADRVTAVVAAVPAGTVVSYGEVAAEAGVPGAARAVGRVLRTHGGGLPWWRVVTATGRLVPGLEEEQAARLRAEGVACYDGSVQMRRNPDAPTGVSPGAGSSGAAPSRRHGRAT